MTDQTKPPKPDDNDVALLPVDIRPFADGNTGIAYATRWDSGAKGPHALINALTHGNEVCGAHALSFLFAQNIRPKRGILTLSFANVGAYHAFDAKNPTASRFLDEDFNRVWSDEVLKGPRQSRELTRAREMLPLVESADYLLDIHSMQTKTPPLMLAGMQEKGRSLAMAVGVPAAIVVDAGHSAGVRMRDYRHFADSADPRTALLVECGQHWELASRTIAIETTLRFLLALDMVDAEKIAPHLSKTPLPRQRSIEVTNAITIQSNTFQFTNDYYGMEVIPKSGTIIATEEGKPIRTPYDDCVLIMPNRRLQKGQTAVRLGRFVS